ncbi:hypothetical protein PFLmoz3_04229 [Pseudomonas fluorescens]|uniref:Uncharacterized protein n=1 Tax=Pseudomonas fluorescens TaxID=294 RepID=A0A109LEE6_PSEFL|nr:hypothetical protein PFLmoz3_04229 [Pseudomonas fluorescens]
MSWVRVPVLSVHSTSIEPKFWIALRRLTTTLRLAMAVAPLARLALTIIGSISGVRPTATARANRKASPQSPLEKPLRKNTMGTITSMKRISSQLTLFTPRSKAVCTREPTIALAREPK